MNQYTPEVSLLVTTFQRPGHLRRALESIALQQGIDGRFEVLVVDDGSQDETPQVVADFARQAGFPVGFTTHPHEGFRVARSRNEGVAASSAPYVLFIDGDCVLPPDHVRIHLERRQPSVAWVGDCHRLEPEASKQVTLDTIRNCDYRHLANYDEDRRLARASRKARFYQWLRHPTKPKLIGNNVGIWRVDYERVNGYDESFQGWGCEDDDLGRRLRRAGVQLRTILPWTHTYHLWHPQETTQPKRWREGLNVGYLLRSGALTRCRNGLIKRETADLSIRLIGDPAHRPLVERALGKPVLAGSPAQRPEVEILILPGGGRFSGQADCNLLLAVEDSPQVERAAAQAHIVVGPRAYPRLANSQQFRLDQLPEALSAVA